MIHADPATSATKALRAPTMHERHHLRSLERAGLVERYYDNNGTLRWRSVERPDHISPEEWATVGTFRPITS